MHQWISNVPRGDIEKIERIYIIPASDSDYRGTYMPILCTIMVEWILPFSNYNPLSKLSLLSIEKTLYHEIGHHVNNHTFGHDLEQEEEAEQYAKRLMAISHPNLKLTVNIIKSIFKRKNNVTESNKSSYE